MVDRADELLAVCNALVLACEYLIQSVYALGSNDPHVEKIKLQVSDIKQRLDKLS